MLPVMVFTRYVIFVFTLHHCNKIPSLRKSQHKTIAITICKAEYNDRRDGVVVRASASQSVDLEFIPLVESYQMTFKNGIYSFPTWRSAFMGGCGEQAGKFAYCVLGQGT